MVSNQFATRIERTHSFCLGVRGPHVPALDRQLLGQRHFARRLCALFAVVFVLHCDSDPPPKSRPNTGYGYGREPRTLTPQDCRLLRDHLVDISISSALDGGNSEALERELRYRFAQDLADWVHKCEGRIIATDDFRCMRDATIPRTFLQCGRANEADTKPAISDASSD
jgi:hypothetical protein